MYVNISSKSVTDDYPVFAHIRVPTVPIVSTNHLD